MFSFKFTSLEKKYNFMLSKNVDLDKNTVNAKKKKIIKRCEMSLSK